MLRTAVGGVRAVCDKGCSKSCGTAGHQTLPAARQSLADQADSSCSACSVAETRRLVGHRSIGRVSKQMIIYPRSTFTHDFPYFR